MSFQTGVGISGRHDNISLSLAHRGAGKTVAIFNVTPGRMNENTAATGFFGRLAHAERLYYARGEVAVKSVLVPEEAANHLAAILSVVTEPVVIGKRGQVPANHLRKSVPGW
jgi:hypothetical protein